MKRLDIAFLWHMHQPNYRDPIRGYFSMPWVRLHATKAYYDMALLAERFPEMRLTFNLVPALLEQLDDYGAGMVDFELLLSRTDPADLTGEEKEALLSRFFQANRDTMINPLPRYRELLQFRGEQGTWSDIRRAAATFAAQDYLDLQVLFNLAWFGFSARDEDDEVRKLIRKGRRFTTEDRDFVLERQQTIMARLMPLYRQLWDREAIDITTSPFYHPILPLLCDTSSACASMPGCLLPNRRFRHPEDAARQVDMGIEFVKNRLGRKPTGMWPSEGSVSPESLDIIARAGISWAATDEGVLARSIPGFQRDHDLYHPWQAHGVGMFFRDIRLSDQIGFVYSRNPAQVAVEDFIGRLGAIAEAGDGSPRLASVILDGENAWEFYQNSGRDFLEMLYARILKEPWLNPVTFSEYLEEHPPERSVDAIFPASWINGSYDTWIGDKEEADGWDALGAARDALVAHESELDPADAAEAWRELFRAEGSDWFWWYGDDHSSVNDPEFDRLFRAHLERIYQILGLEVPPQVREPIITVNAIRVDAEPTGFISPIIDGRITTFYEWLAAGWFPAVGPEGAMSGNEPLFSDVYYGFDSDNFYLRLDFSRREEPVDLSRWSFSLFIENSESYRIDAGLDHPADFIINRRASGNWVRRSRKPDITVGRVVELAVAFRDMNLKPGDHCLFTVTVSEDKLERERLPRTGSVPFIVPDRTFLSRMWQV